MLAESRLTLAALAGRVVVDAAAADGWEAAERGHFADAEIKFVWDQDFIRVGFGGGFFSWTHLRLREQGLVVWLL